MGESCEEVKLSGKAILTMADEPSRIVGFPLGGTWYIYVYLAGG